MRLGGAQTTSAVRPECQADQYQREELMRRIVSMTFATCATMALCTPILAQAPAPATPPAAPSAGGTADGISFDIPYGVSIGLERAKQAMAAAEAEAKKHC